jgi:hypothetical protein
MPQISSVIAAGTTLLALALPVAAQAAIDRNHDRIPDQWERTHHLSLRINQAKRDQDRDGLVNRSEYLDHTDPHRKDSDRDGVPDGHEDADDDGVTNAAEQEHHDSAAAPDGASRPAPGSSHPEPGASLTEPVGSVVSFAGGKLDVRQADGTDLVATVDAATRLLCAPPVDKAVAKACPSERLLPGTRVLVARQTSGHWDLVVLRSSGGGSPTEPPPPPAPPAPPPAAAPRPPALPAAPASTGVLSAIGDGSITITRPNGEIVPGLVRSSTVLRCIRVADGHAVSTEPCGSPHLVLGAQVATAQRALVDGAWTWKAITLLEQAT